jgi:anti-sigma regulatory factor (Ser/Thr protein kinase)
VIRPGASWVDDQTFQRLHLAVYELLVNISRHAYRRSNGPIELIVVVGPASVRVSVFDFGQSFEGELPPALPDEPSTGRYGLPLVAAIADQLRYRRLGQENHWQIELVDHRPASS